SDGGVVGEGILVGGAVDRGGLEQLPAVEDRLRVDRRSATAGGPDREVEVWRLSGGLADVPDHGAAGDLGADLERLQLHRVGVELQAVREGRLEGLVAGHAAAEQPLDLAADARVAGVAGALRQGEEPLAG